MEAQVQNPMDEEGMIVQNPNYIMGLLELPSSEKPADAVLGHVDGADILVDMNGQAVVNGEPSAEVKKRVAKENERLIAENDELRRRIEALEAASRRPIRRQRQIQEEQDVLKDDEETAQTVDDDEPGASDDDRPKSSSTRRKRGRPCRKTTENGDDDAPTVQRRKRRRRKTKAYSCSDCEKTFRTEVCLKRHQSSKHGDTPPATFSCSQCEKAFCDKTSLNRHMQVHSEYKPHLCNLCGASFTQSGNLNRHLQRHSGEKQYQCTICPKSFTRKHKLREHMVKHEKGLITIPPPQTPSIMCQFCTKLFGSFEALQNHQNSTDCEKHQKSLRPKPTEEELLTQGKRVHKCHLCGKIFTHPANLARHIKIHSGVKPHVCPTCNRGFARAAELATHAVVHTGAKPWACDLCDKRFSQRAHVYRHRRKHTGERSHFCHICKKSYIILADLIKHLDVHTSGKPKYKCEVCKMVFGSGALLEGHIRDSHLPVQNAKAAAPLPTTYHPQQAPPTSVVAQQPRPVQPSQSDAAYRLPHVVMAALPSEQQQTIHHLQPQNPVQQQENGGPYVYASPQVTHYSTTRAIATGYVSSAPLPVLHFSEFPQVHIQQNGNAGSVTLANQVRHTLDMSQQE